jgi:hypothetical protein
VLHRAGSFATLEASWAAGDLLLVFLTAYRLRTDESIDSASLYAPIETERGKRLHEAQFRRPYQRSTFLQEVSRWILRLVKGHCAVAPDLEADSGTAVNLRHLQRLLGLRDDQAAAWHRLVEQVEDQAGVLPAPDAPEVTWRLWQARFRRHVRARAGREVIYPVDVWDNREPNGRRRPWCWGESDFIGLLIQALSWARTCPMSSAAAPPREIHPGLVAWAQAHQLLDGKSLQPTREGWGDRPRETVVQERRDYVTWCVELPAVPGAHWYVGNGEDRRRVSSADSSLDFKYWNEEPTAMNPLVLCDEQGDRLPDTRTWRVEVPACGRWVSAAQQWFDPETDGLKDPAGADPPSREECWWIGPGEPPGAPPGRVWASETLRVRGLPSFQARRLGAEARGVTLRIEGPRAAGLRSNDPVYYFRDGSQETRVLIEGATAPVEIALESVDGRRTIEVEPGGAGLVLADVLGESGPLWVNVECASARRRLLQLCLVRSDQWFTATPRNDGGAWMVSWPARWRLRVGESWKEGPSSIELPVEVDGKTFEVSTSDVWFSRKVCWSAANPIERVWLEDTKAERVGTWALLPDRTPPECKLEWRRLCVVPRWRLALSSSNPEQYRVSTPIASARITRSGRVKYYHLGTSIGEAIREGASTIQIELVEAGSGARRWELHSAACHFAPVSSFKYTQVGQYHSSKVGLGVPSQRSSRGASPEAAQRIQWVGAQELTTETVTRDHAAVRVVFNEAPATLGPLWHAGLLYDDLPGCCDVDQDLGVAARLLFAASYANRSGEVLSTSQRSRWLDPLRELVGRTKGQFASRLPWGWHRAWCASDPESEARLLGRELGARLHEGFDAKRWTACVRACAEHRHAPAREGAGPWESACDRWSRVSRSWLRARALLRELLAPVQLPPAPDGFQPYTRFLGPPPASTDLALGDHLQPMRGLLPMPLGGEAQGGLTEGEAFLRLPFWALEVAAKAQTIERSRPEERLPTAVAALAFLEMTREMLRDAPPMTGTALTGAETWNTSQWQ